MKVLAVFANPRGTNALRLAAEDKKIEECIQRSKHRDNIQLVRKHAVTVEDVRRALLDDNFDIVHFSGHATGTGLAFEDNAGRMYIPPRDAIAGLLEEFVPPLQCILMNACYSTSQGKFTSLGVPITIAMEGPISDTAALLFTGGFYDSIGAGKDIEFSFRQGVHALRLAGHSDSRLPRIIHKGEMIDIPEQPHAPAVDGARMISELTTVAPQPLLVGIGIDVSGSMETNIDNRTGSKQTRLDGFREALSEGIENSKRFLTSVQQTDAPVHLFAYAFGLRTGAVCDLLSLIKAADGIISKEEIETLKERYTREIKDRYASRSDLGSLGSLARSLGYGRLVDSAMDAARASGEAEVRNKILAEVQRRLSAKLQIIGDTTLGINELAELWKESSTSFADAEGLIFGNTPMCEALRKIHARFKAELQKSADNALPILLLISDGEPTDGDPLELGKQIQELGVTVICCYIMSTDVGEPRTLFSQAGTNWPTSARKMFEMASVLPEDSPLKGYLLRQGWTIPEKAKTFIQVNRSEILEELVGLAFSPIEAGYELLPKGQ